VTEVYYVGGTVRLFARIDDTLTGGAIRSGTKPTVSILQPDGSTEMVPDASVDWIAPTNAKAYKNWSVTAVWTPTQVGQHTAIFNVSAPYSGKAEEKFWVHPLPSSS
jgi:hypothetical protein